MMLMINVRNVSRSIRRIERNLIATSSGKLTGSNFHVITAGFFFDIDLPREACFEKRRNKGI